MKSLNNYNHPFHMTSNSPWPLIMSTNVMNLMLNIFIWMNFSNFIPMIMGMFSILLIMFQWWRDLIRESLFQGSYTTMIYNNMKFCMLLFISSELMFFISFFWTYFHSFLSPNIEIGMQWPPMNISPFNPFNIPLMNTIILISSSSTITWSHHAMLNNKYNSSILSMMSTITLSMIFMYFQYLEYSNSKFSINDSIYGSIFFMTTGFHGTHVIIGSIFLSINLIRMMNKQFSSHNHFGMEASIWYWHFVDMIWLFLFMLIYWWSI
uniref:Cytochrome c oxidase subunit 3 n=1 Tax=Vanhornia eucnemidarum TaxID=32432 RepID=Q0H2F7_9HYME|nr:cytochrome c oxidase subunit III [Vanhornia eucnemidarum]